MISAHATLTGSSLAHPTQQHWVWFTPLILVVLLAAVSTFNYLLFHTLAELFAVIVALMLSVVAWQMYPFTRNNFLMYLGCGYFWIGMMDLAHALSFEGMPLIPAAEGDISIGLWVYTRYTEAFVLMTAPYFLTRRLNRTLVFYAYMAWMLAGMVWILTGSFPTTYVSGVGLTPFKVYTEYLIILFLLVAIIHVWKCRQLLEPKMLYVMIAAMLFTMAAEMAFTYYTQLFDPANMVGHLFKIFSYWLIFLAVIRTTLQEPFLAMARGISTYDAVPDPTVILDSDGVVHQANRAAVELIGAPKEHILGQHVHRLLHPAQIPQRACPICQAIASNSPLDSAELMLDEQGHWFDYSLSSFSAMERLRGMVQVMRDITHKRYALQAKRDSDEQLSLLLNSTAEAIYGMDRDGCCSFANPAGLAMLGYDNVDEILGKDLHNLIHHSYANGDPFPASECRVYKAIQEGRGVHVDDEVLWRKDGSSFAAEYWSYPIIKDDEVMGAVVTFLDISQRNKTERELHRYKDNLEDLVEERTREMAAAYQELDAFSYSVSHDLRAPLRSIDGFSLALFEDYYELVDETGKDYLLRIRKSVQRLGGLIDELLMLSRISRQEMNSGRLDLTAIAEDVLDELQDLDLVGKAEVHIARDMEAWGDANLLRIVLHNLLANALKYSRARKPPRIELNCLTNFQGYDKVFVMQDNGVGFDMKYAGALFAPFQRLHGADEFEGSGIGLATVKRIIQRHGGELWADAKLNQGASFYFTLPK